MGQFKKKYCDLETQVMAELRSRIEKSTDISKHMAERAIKVNLFNYRELTIINGRLTFLCEGGFHYDSFTEATLEDLIDILESS